MAMTGTPSSCIRSHVDALLFEYPQGVRGEVLDAVALDLVGEEVGDLIDAHPARVGPGGVEEGAAGAVDRPHHLGGEIDEVVGEGAGIVGVGVEQAAPAAADADNLVTLGRHPIDDRLDAGIQAGNVAAAGQDSDSHVASLCWIGAGRVESMCRIFSKSRW
jgi:hypothetical protein